MPKTRKQVVLVATTYLLLRLPRRTDSVGVTPPELRRSGTPTECTPAELRWSPSERRRTPAPESKTPTKGASDAGKLVGAPTDSD